MSGISLVMLTHCLQIACFTIYDFWPIWSECCFDFCMAFVALAVVEFSGVALAETFLVAAIVANVGNW